MTTFLVAIQRKSQRDLTEDQRFYNEMDQIKKGGSTQGYEF